MNRCEECKRRPTDAAAIVSDGAFSFCSIKCADKFYTLCRARKTQLKSPDSAFKEQKQVKPSEVLRAGAKHMEDRSATYDKPAGERSMAATVNAFNVITGHSVTEEQGWLMMSILKMVRSQQGRFKLDNYEDGAAYFALAAEAGAESRSDLVEGVKGESL